MKENIQQLKETVERMHNCKATFVETVNVAEAFQGNAVWEGIVHVFDITGNPISTRCYAWSSPIEGNTKRRYYAVLKVPPIDSPEKAVRASIIQDYKMRTK